MSRYTLIGIFLVVLLLCNWPYVYHEVKTDAHGTSPTPLQVDNPSISHQLRLAGWPCKFYQSAGTDGDPPRTSFYWQGLAFNFLSWSAIGLGVGLYVMLGKRMPRSQRPDAESYVVDISAAAIAAPATRSPRSGIGLRDLFLLTAVIAGTCGYWLVLKSRRDREQQLTNEIHSHGGTTKSVAMLPVLTTRITPLHAACLRITDVYLQNPDNALVEKVVALPYLRNLIIAGGSYDLGLLNRLTTSPMLAELGIIGRPLDQPAVATIGSMSALRTLNLMRTNITAQGIHAIGQPDLRELNIIHTDVNLAELGRPPFADSLRKLRAPRPPKGQGDSLVLEDWPELEEFACFEYDELLNPEPVVLKLKNLPKLSSIHLDVLQLYDLELERLPSLSKIELRREQWRERTTPRQHVPSFAWIRNLRVAEVPKLGELGIYATHTNSIEIDQLSPMTFGICVFNQGYHRNPETAFEVQIRGAGLDALKPGYLTSADIALPVRQKWIDDLGNCSGVKHVSLYSTPLSGLDLAPLKKNKSIRRLSLGYSALQASQLHDLKGMDQLEEISLDGLDIDGRTIEELVKSFPNLRTLDCERSTVTRLRLENAPNLESIFKAPPAESRAASTASRMLDGYSYSTLDALRIIDAPKLQDSFFSNVSLKHLHIEKAPLLSGLSFQLPLPTAAVIKDVANLKFFAAGGPTCTDAIASEAMKSPGLKKLTLAYTDLSPATMQSIANLSDLDYLVLTGSRVDDQLVESLSGLTNLRVLRLDQTGVTNRSIPTISKFTQLELLDLGTLQLSAQDAMMLVSNLTNLKSLDLAGVPLSLEHLQKISSLNRLQMLDLSRSELNDEKLNWLANYMPPSLLELKLNSVKLGAEGFREVLKRSHSSLSFALADTDVNPVVLDWLVSQERVTSLANESDQAGMTEAQRRILRMQMMNRPSGTGYESYQQRFDVSKGEIDPLWFASPQSVAPDSDFGEESALRIPSPPPTNLFQRLGYEIFRLQNWGARPDVSY